MTKEIKPEPPSQMEQIRLKSTDPDFLRECDVESRKTHDLNKERDYTALLKQRGVDDVELRNRVRVGFEAECAVKP